MEYNADCTNSDNSTIKQLPLTYIFNDGTGGIDISIFFFICQFFGMVLAINQERLRVKKKNV